jgi:hypothetical protein
MGTFQIISRLWPDGRELDLGIDSNSVSGPSGFGRSAQKFETDGKETYTFLFWNTGRHLTGKLNVHWTFRALNWQIWTATRWYGILPGGGDGKPMIQVDAFSIGGDQRLTSTPIDASRSIFEPGAYPVNDNDHLISTEPGDVTVVAKDPHEHLDFAGWLQLFYGGDDIGDFEETDEGSYDRVGGYGFYDHVGDGHNSLTILRNYSAILLAAYGFQSPIIIPEVIGGDFSEPSTIGGNSTGSNTGPGGDYDPLPPQIDRIIELEKWLRKPDPLLNPFDDSPMGRIRLAVAKQILSVNLQSDGSSAAMNVLIKNAGKMSYDTLNVTRKSISKSIDLAKKALIEIDSQLKTKKK